MRTSASCPGFGQLPVVGMRQHHQGILHNRLDILDIERMTATPFQGFPDNIIRPEIRVVEHIAERVRGIRDQRVHVLGYLVPHVKPPFLPDWIAAAINGNGGLILESEH